MSCCATTECLCSDIGPDVVRFVFVTPEKISSSKSLMDLLSRLSRRRQLSRFIVDEAHCVSQWGNDFRPDYTKLRVLRDSESEFVSEIIFQDFPDVPMLAMTATATKSVIEDVISGLRMKNPLVFKRSFDRPNLM